ncbi:MAG: peroxiredoxin [Actinobacteria bacterium]|nr:peroxiredoxin [Actinomycetota bacterium]
MLKEKTNASDFNLLDQDKNMHRLSDYKGKWIVLYFYPKDDSPGCTKEAANFRDNIDQFHNLNVEIIGISSDSPESHKKFINKYNLKILLLSDTKKEVIKEYEAGGLITRRISYLINPEGKIEKIYPKVNPSKHAQEILKDLRKIL